MSLEHSSYCPLRRMYLENTFKKTLNCYEECHCVFYEQN